MKAIVKVYRDDPRYRWSKRTAVILIPESDSDEAILELCDETLFKDKVTLHTKESFAVEESQIKALFDNSPKEEEEA